MPQRVSTDRRELAFTSVTELDAEHGVELGAAGRLVAVAQLSDSPDKP